MLRVSYIFLLLIGVYKNTNAKQCSLPGKFPQDQVGDCSGYALCLIAGVGIYAQYNLTCPSGFIFNHELSLCTNETSYRCEPDFYCNETGRFPSPFSENRTAYIACVEGMNDIMTARSIECPSDYIFNPIVSTCIESIDIAHESPKPMNNVGELTAFHVSMFLVIFILHILF
ncbi:hypothetical protein evm_006401 [Chilo suppressalis]|nr:hypothetical protein evm_006401 [Chilo suppressalis]